MRRPRPANSRSAPEGAAAPEAVTLSHCAPGDPCERTLTLRADGTVHFSALCAEMLPVAEALTPDLPPIVEA